jgi:hypothetical protein
MKKCLLLLTILMSTFTMFANPWDIKTKNFVSHAPWDRPLEKKLFTPEVYWATITIVDDYNVIVRTSLTESDPNHTWRSRMSVNAEWYVKVGFNTWQWQTVTYLWDIDIPPGNSLYDKYILLPRKTRFYSIDGGQTVDESQYSVYDFFQL